MQNPLTRRRFLGLLGAVGAITSLGMTWSNPYEPRPLAAVGKQYFIVPKRGAGTPEDPITPDIDDDLDFCEVSDEVTRANNPIGDMLICVNAETAILDGIAARLDVTAFGDNIASVKTGIEVGRFEGFRDRLATQRLALINKGIKRVPADPLDLLYEAYDNYLFDGSFDNNLSRADIDFLVNQWRIMDAHDLTLQEQWRVFVTTERLSYKERDQIRPHLNLRHASIIATETWDGSGSWPSSPNTWIEVLAALGYTISGNKGKQGGTNTGSGFAVIDEINEEDTEVLAEVEGTSSGAEQGCIHRVHDGVGTRDNAYFVLNEGTDMEIYKKVDGANTRIQNASGNNNEANDLKIRSRCESNGIGGTVISWSIWLKSGAEPTFPEKTVTNTDAALQAVSGETGVYAQLAVSVARFQLWDNLTVDDLKVAEEEEEDEVASMWWF